MHCWMLAYVLNLRDIGSMIVVWENENHQEALLVGHICSRACTWQRR
jgi:hypothetical protein